ncbi:MAG: hypothetical protein ABS57_15405 [Mesorhizobium sp. SCN 65-12]|nr:MAG: hypothetical protein ABS57_15405 [Mesorhizobium sp. SCN 65-12]
MGLLPIRLARVGGEQPVARKGTEPIQSVGDALDESGLVAELLYQIQRTGVQPPRNPEVRVEKRSELFDKQSEDYRKKTIGDAPVKMAIEAGIRQGWDHLIGSDGVFIGMTGFGASGTIEQLYPHFGITADAAVKAAQARLGGK